MMKNCVDYETGNRSRVFNAGRIGQVRARINALRAKPFRLRFFSRDFHLRFRQVDAQQAALGPTNERTTDPPTSAAELYDDGIGGSTLGEEGASSAEAVTAKRLPRLVVVCPDSFNSVRVRIPP
jgi:hypothetical protein